MKLSENEQQRYSRHLQLPEIAETGQEKLKDSSVLIIGAGGLGGPLAYYLAAAGVGRLTLVDPDKLELSNLQRQILYSETDIGSYKVIAAQKRLQRFNSNLEIKARPCRFEEQSAPEILKKATPDIIVDATDNFPSRLIINRVALENKLPFVHGAVYRFEGQLALFSPLEGPCYSCLYPELEKTPVAPQRVAGPAAVMPGIIATLQANEVIKYLLSIGRLLTGKLLTVDALNLSFRKLTVNRLETCQVCQEIKPADHSSV